MRRRNLKFLAGLSSLAILACPQQASAQLLDLGQVIAALLDLDATVTVLGQDVLGLSTTVATQGSLLASVDAQVLGNTNNITNLQVNLGNVSAQVGVNTGDITNLQAGVGGLTAQVAANLGDITGLQTGLSGLTGQVTANIGDIANLQLGLGANILRDDDQDAAIGTLSTGLAANNLRDDAQDVRLDYHEATLAQHDTRITEARQIGVTALAAATQVRDDVEAGRVGLVRTAADGSLAIGGNLGGRSVSFAGTAGNRRLSGVANGVAADDAATVGQVQTVAAMTLAAAQDYTDGKLVGINNSFLARISENNEELRTEINAAAASTAALAGLPQAFVPGKGMFAMGMGGKGNQAAIAFGVGKAFNHPNVPVVRAGAAVNTGNGDVTYNAAVGIHF